MKTVLIDNIFRFNTLAFWQPRLVLDLIESQNRFQQPGKLLHTPPPKNTEIGDEDLFTRFAELPPPRKEKKISRMWL